MRKLALIVALACVINGVLITLGRTEDKWQALVQEAGKVLSEIQQMPDQNIPEKLLRSCAAIAIFPSTISAGLVVGGKYGQGVILAKDPLSRRWSSPAVFTIAGGSLGWQIGGQATDFVLLIMNARSLDGILQGKFKLGADAAVAAGPVGRDAEASLDVQLKGGILSYSRSRGLFAGIKLAGDVITQHWEGNKTLYGKGLSAKEILKEDKAQQLKSAQLLLSVLNRYR